MLYHGIGCPGIGFHGTMKYAKTSASLPLNMPVVCTPKGSMLWLPQLVFNFAILPLSNSVNLISGYYRGFRNLSMIDLIEIQKTKFANIRFCEFDQ